MFPGILKATAPNKSPARPQEPQKFGVFELSGCRTGIPCSTAYFLTALSCTFNPAPGLIRHCYNRPPYILLLPKHPVKLSQIPAYHETISSGGRSALPGSNLSPPGTYSVTIKELTSFGLVCEESPDGASTNAEMKAPPMRLPLRRG